MFLLFTKAPIPVPVPAPQLFEIHMIEAKKSPISASTIFSFSNRLGRARQDHCTWVQVFCFYPDWYCTLVRTGPYHRVWAARCICNARGPRGGGGCASLVARQAPTSVSAPSRGTVAPAHPTLGSLPLNTTNHNHGVGIFIPIPFPATSGAAAPLGLRPLNSL